VVLQLNGQNVEGAEQLRRLLREIPAGRKVSLVISRDGNMQTMAVELVDRKAMEHDVWNKIGNGGDLFAQAPPGMGILAGGGDAPLPGGFRLPFFGSTLNVGALVEPLTSQMADYLGVPNGLMVKQVARKSEAASAGFKAFDVILKVGPEGIRTLSDWERALHANQGKPVQVTILRDKKQQTLTLQVDSKRHSELEIQDLFPECTCEQMAGIDPEFVQSLAPEFAADDAAQSLRSQLDDLHLQIDPQQVEEMRKQAEALRGSFKGENFGIDQKQMDQLRQQMEEFRQTFKPEDLQIDPRQMDELRQQMDQLKRQMEEMKAPGFDGRV